MTLYFICSDNILFTVLFNIVAIGRMTVAETCTSISFIGGNTMVLGCDLMRALDYDGSLKDVWINCKKTTCEPYII